MTVSSQAAHAQILAALARVRAILDEVGAQAQRTATQHERLAAWHAKRGEARAAQGQRQAAAVQRLRLAELDAGVDALDMVAAAVLELGPAATPALAGGGLPRPAEAVVTAAGSFLNGQSESGQEQGAGH